MNPDPAPYPQKNTEEIAAIHTLIGLLDIYRVKIEARFLDKVPNSDGSVELVDTSQKTIGELKIQIKKIPTGEVRFDCPVELVGYSTRISSPFILICVDVEKKKAYWIHLNRTMPEFRDGQKTFTVKFRSLIDEIGQGFPYFERWLEICTSYLTRISKFPEYKRYAEEEIGLGSIDQKDLIFFQRFVDEINTLLDVDFPTVKDEQFAGSWKLGVSIHNLDENNVHYSIYTIPSGSNAPLIRLLPRSGEFPKMTTDEGIEINGITSMSLEGISDDERMVRWESRKTFAEPISEARRIVMGLVKKAFKGRQFGVFGVHQSSELLLWFARSYPRAIGLPEADRYCLKDLEYGLSVFLPMWYSLLRPRATNFIKENHYEAYQANPLLSFEQIYSMVEGQKLVTSSEIQQAIETRLRPCPLPVFSESFRIRSLRQALDYLHSEGIETIYRWEKPRSRPAANIFDCYEPGDLKSNLISMVRKSVSDYPEFVRTNSFGRFTSRVISGEDALVLVIDKLEMEGGIPKRCTVFHVANGDRTLPLFSVIDLEEDPGGFKLEGRLVRIAGVEKPWKRWWSPLMIQFGDRCPVQTGIYELLRADLRERFGKQFH